MQRPERTAQGKAVEKHQELPRAAPGPPNLPGFHQDHAEIKIQPEAVNPGIRLRS